MLNYPKAETQYEYPRAAPAGIKAYWRARVDDELKKDGIRELTNRLIYRLSAGLPCAIEFTRQNENGLEEYSLTFRN